MEISDLPPAEDKDLSGRNQAICEYHLQGFTNQEIAKQFGLHFITIGNILKTPPAKKYLAGRVEDLNLQFHGQFASVIQTMQDALTHEDIQVRMRAADSWMKAHGRFAPKDKEAKGPVSAEDVVAKLLEHSKHVHINIDNRKQEIVLGDGQPPPPMLSPLSFMSGDSE